MSTERDDRFADLLTAHLDERAERSLAPAAGGDADAGREALFGAVTDQLSAEATWGGPPPGLRDMILARIRTETRDATDEAVSPSPIATEREAAAPAKPEAAEPMEPVELAEPEVAEPAEPEAVDPLPEPEAAPEPVDRPVHRPERDRPAAAWWRPGSWRPRARRLTWAIPVGALAAAVFTAGVLAVDRALAPDPPRGEVYAATGTGLAPGATAEVSVVDTPSGSSIVLEPAGLPAAAPGSYYAAWLKGPKGTVPIGSFHERRTGVPIELWSGVDVDDYTTLSVTLQAEGDPPTPSGLVVMTASLTR
ncbi:anti-sigma factor [Asanoa sp. WMMD1127]|uniref:anti-sigma factor n=1 Tax=Asanoa sp. WMMD1127 TaxID=3016107 RepID=UPI002416872F|nr:anti-sigma factor [Asanoa sp. WMMD1127]MDG4825744.1 anti-sigma factor [Asanoa sp. WMMD1127]